MCFIVMLYVYDLLAHVNKEYLSLNGIKLYASLGMKDAMCFERCLLV